MKTQTGRLRAVIAGVALIAFATLATAGDRQLLNAYRSALDTIGPPSIKLDVWKQFIKQFPKDNPYMAEALGEVKKFTWTLDTLEKRNGSKWFTEGCDVSPTGRGGDMCHVPAGEFFRGCNELVDKACESDEKPYRPVELSAYYVDRQEVTVEQYTQCVQAGSCSDRGLKREDWAGKDAPKWLWACNWQKNDRSDHPMNCLNWYQAKAYCEWAGKRLPTEAEWEKAARGLVGWRYPWGNRPDASCALSVINSGGVGCGENRTWPVCSKPAGNSPYGLCDASGNVWEWVADYYHDWYYGKKASLLNPRGPSIVARRVLRGGAWYNEARYVRASNRFMHAASGHYYRAGVRCALSAAVR